MLKQDLGMGGVAQGYSSCPLSKRAELGWGELQVVRLQANNSSLAAIIPSVPNLMWTSGPAVLPPPAVDCVLLLVPSLKPPMRYTHLVLQRILPFKEVWELTPSHKTQEQIQV